VLWTIRAPQVNTAQDVCGLACHNQRIYACCSNWQIWSMDLTSIVRLTNFSRPRIPHPIVNIWLTAWQPVPSSPCNHLTGSVLRIVMGWRPVPEETRQQQGGIGSPCLENCVHGAPIVTVCGADRVARRADHLYLGRRGAHHLRRQVRLGFRGQGGGGGLSNELCLCPAGSCSEIWMRRAKLGTAGTASAAATTASSSPPTRSTCGLASWRPPPPGAIGYRGPAHSQAHAPCPQTGAHRNTHRLRLAG
jgi:hypothetical protein